MLSNEIFSATINLAVSNYTYLYTSNGGLFQPDSTLLAWNSRYISAFDLRE